MMFKDRNLHPITSIFRGIIVRKVLKIKLLKCMGGMFKYFFRGADSYFHTMSIFNQPTLIPKKNNLIDN